MFVGVRFRKVHDLELLCRELPDGWSLSEDPERLSGLTVWAVEPRYPNDLPEATEDDARSAASLARDVFETTLRDLEDHGYDHKKREGPAGESV